MIDYDVFCQAIADWKAGRAPARIDHGAPAATDEIVEYDAYDEELAEVADEEFREEPEEHTVIYQLPIEPLDDDDL